MAYVAAVIAMKDSELVDFDHRRTSLHVGVGQSYADMWPYIRKGIDASLNKGEFDMGCFATRGYTRISPFFSIRALPALPIALIAERFQICGEGCVQSSFGAETVVALQHGLQDIQSGKTCFALVGGADCVSNPHTIENLYFNDFFRGDFYGSTSASFVILEEREHNRRRGGKSYCEIIFERHKCLPVSEGNLICYQDDVFNGLCPEVHRNAIRHVVTSATGTIENHRVERACAERLFCEAQHEFWFESCGSLLAASEPFGTILLALRMKKGGLGISLSRSVCGSESSVIISKADDDVS
jgi:hypothetical protein